MSKTVYKRPGNQSLRNTLTVVWNTKLVYKIGWYNYYLGNQAETTHVVSDPGFAVTQDRSAQEYEQDYILILYFITL